MRLDSDLKRYRGYALALVVVNLMAAAFAASRENWLLGLACFVWAGNCAVWAHASTVAQRTRDVNRELIAVTKEAIDQMGRP